MNNSEYIRDLGATLDANLIPHTLDEVADDVARLERRRPKALDMFCCAGGVSEGLRRAGFDVVGVDINPQPRYPFPFIQADAMSIDTRGFDLVCASPPCQRYSCLTKPQHKERHPDLIAQVREKLIASGALWVIENVPHAPINATVKLDGTMFPGLFVVRERLFECSFPVPQPKSTAYRGMVKDGKAISVHGGGCRHRKDRHTTENFRKAMGIDWMNRGELSEAIPPAYAEYIGRHAMRALSATKHKICANCEDGPVPCVKKTPLTGGKCIHHQTSNKGDTNNG